MKCACAVVNCVKSVVCPSLLFHDYKKKKKLWSLKYVVLFSLNLFRNVSHSKTNLELGSKCT